MSKEKFKIEMTQRLYDVLMLDEEIRSDKLLDDINGYYIHFNKLVYVLTDGGIIDSNDLDKLETYIYHQVINFDNEWIEKLNKKEATVISKKFIDGQVVETKNSCYFFCLCDMALLCPIIIDFILDIKPDLRYL
nr:hypothetical protein [Mimivirus sp.]